MLMVIGRRVMGYIAFKRVAEVGCDSDNIVAVDFNLDNVTVAVLFKGSSGDSSGSR